MAERGGQPENNNAGKNKPFWRTLDRVIAQDDGKKLRLAAERLVDMAVAGDIQAIKELGDRLDGKAAQAIVGHDGGQLTVQIVASDADA